MKLYFRITLFYFILLSGVHEPVRAQKVTLKEADALFNHFQYALALSAYQKLIKEQKPTLYLTQRIAECYRQLHNAKETELWYNRVIQFANFKPEALRYAADATRANGKYDHARLLYEQYGQRVPTQARLANQLAAGCDSAQQWLAKPEPYEVQKTENINSENSDFSPVLFQNNLIFTSDRPESGGKNKKISGWTGNPFPKIYSASRQNDGRFSSPVAFGSPINNQYHNGSAAFSADGQTVYFTRINQVKTAPKKGNTDPFSWVIFEAERPSVNRLEIYISRKEGENWSEPTPFVYNKASVYSVGHPTISPDGSILYFVSDMPGGYGETDIYYCLRQFNGTWGKPVNAGKEINTAGKEVFPAITNNKLYFSSEGHPGMGGLDIFSAEGKGSTWKNVQNLKYPLNSPADDFGITFDETKEAGFLSSNRNSDNGTDNIYAFKLVRISCQLAGRVMERILRPKGEFTEKAVAGAQLRLYPANDTTIMVRIYSDAQGNFTAPVKSGIIYTLQASKEGYLIKSTDFTPECTAEAEIIKQTVILDRNTLNSTIILENIYYDFDKYDIRSEAMPELDKLVRILQDNPTIRIELGSHTDSRQTIDYNKRLSQLRAEAAVNYVISRGIDPSRLIAKGYGETKLLNSCRDGVSCSELEHQINRRTEVKILRR